MPIFCTPWYQYASIRYKQRTGAFDQWKSSTTTRSPVTHVAVITRLTSVFDSKITFWRMDFVIYLVSALVLSLRSAIVNGKLYEHIHYQNIIIRALLLTMGHYSNVKCVLWRLKSWATRVFVQQFIRDHIKESIKASHYRSFVKGIH